MAEEITVYYVDDCYEQRIESTAARLTAKCLYIPGKYSRSEQRKDRRLDEPYGEVARGYFRTEVQALEGFERQQKAFIERAQSTLDGHENRLDWVQGMLGKEEKKKAKAEAGKEIKVGDVVRDSHGRVGIVTGDDPAPTADWLALQSDPRMRERSKDERWLSVYPLDGGAVASPASLTTRLRRPTPDDLRQALKSVGGFTKEHMGTLFPDFAQEEMEQ